MFCRVQLTLFRRWRAASYRSSFLLIQLSGSTSAGCAGRGADLAGCVSVAGFFLRPQGAFPQAITPFRRLGWSPGGAVGIFGKCRVRVGYGPAPGSTKKRPCATLSRSVGRGTNTAAYVILWTPTRVGCCESCPWDSSLPFYQGELE